ncbi:ATP-binding protein [Streptomyces sp. NPDC007905]|uniref:ATP-binding protein n=1 Tax=Streptomyces sp. NPDC007905 TaxID=3364788 RepID=UPI0036E9557E
MLKPLRQGLPPWDPAAVAEAASCALPARYEAVREARRFTRGTLDKWDVGERFDDICLVVSELVTNALRHGLPLPHHPANEALRSAPCDSAGACCAEHPASVRLHLMHWTERLVCAVRDSSHETPAPRDSDDFSAESGRGLFLVDSFADSWGWHPLAGTLDGKVVWAMFRLRPAG